MEDVKEIPLSDYEKLQIGKIQEWKNEKPNIVSRAVDIGFKPVSWLIQKIVPKAAIKGLLDISNSLAKGLSGKKSIKKLAGVESIGELRTKGLAFSDDIADKIHRNAMKLALAEGASTGAVGLVGIPIDIPAIITLALRTIHRIGLCYGYELKTQDDVKFAFAIMNAAGANSVSEKTASLTYLRFLHVSIAKTTWKKFAQQAATQPISKAGGIIGLRNLAKQLGVNLTKRKLLSAVPAIGAVIGGSVNWWYIKELGWAARRTFQERWLRDNNKIPEIELK